MSSSEAAHVKKRGVDTSSRMLARNSVLNLIGQVLPLFLAMYAIPVVVRGLGTERFGILSLAWIILGYFTVFDLGLGRATTKHVAEALGAGDSESVPRIVWTVAGAQGMLGILGAGVMAAATPLLASKVFKISPELRGDATIVLYILAAGLPILLLSGCFSGTLEASQRFDLSNAVKVPSAILVFLIPLIGTMAHLSLAAIVSGILFTRLAALCCMLGLALAIEPRLRVFGMSWRELKRLLGFGGWVTVSGLVAPALIYLDRFMVASLLSMNAVAFYTAPYEAVSRLLIIPGSITATLYPSFSSLAAAGDLERAGRIFAKSVKYLFLCTSPVIVGLVLFAHEILQRWLGTAFAQQSSLPMQILSLGVLANCLGHVPFSFLQGTGRPDMPAKFHLLELPLHLGLSWIFVRHWGITGAAIAWSTRVLIDALLLFAASWRIGGLRWRFFSSVRMPAAWGALAALCGLAYASAALFYGTSLYFRLVGFAMMLACFGWAVWVHVLDEADRKVMAGLLRI